jgi:hypothetical protein
VYKDASGNVGIGTSSPNIGGANTDNAILTLKGKASTRGGIFEMGNFGTTGNDQTLGWNRYFDGSTENANIEVARASSTSTAYMKFSTNGGSGVTERARITSTGLFGIGTTSPNASYKLTVSGAGSGVIGGLALVDTDAYSFSMYSASSALIFRDVTNSAERARIDSSGNLLVNTTTAIGTITTRNTGGYTMGSVRTGTGGEGHISFRNANGEVGYIQTSGSATQYITSSDYRLKNTIAPMTGALAKVALLKPCTYKWNLDGSDGQGFIAHELAEVVEGCVSGEKDAVDADGNPQYQGIDTSFLVATLTAAIQELKAIVDAQGAEIAALKGTP